MDADLHLHTTASDGTCHPGELVKLAAEVGLAAIAITDHDNVAGIEPALKAGATLGVEVIPGVEINTEWHSLEIHILGYYVDWRDEGFLNLLAGLRESRLGRLDRMLDRLRSVGIHLARDRILAISGEAGVGRPHVARAMVEAGYVASEKEAFERFLAQGQVAYVPRAKLTPAEAVGEILRVNGIPVLAHPGLLSHDEIIPDLIAAGLLGLEVFYPEHSEETVARYLALAKARGLLVTGGSDWHGQEVSRRPLGSFRVAYGLVQELKRATQRAGSPVELE